MPALNQNIVIYDLDRFFVRFTVTDNVNALGGSAWWGVNEVEAGTKAATNAIQKTNNTAMWEYGAASGMTVSSTTIDCEVPLNSDNTTNQSGSLNISPSSYPETYYHELVYSGNSNPDESVVIATGTITVRQSLFTQNSYRI